MKLQSQGLLSVWNNFYVGFLILNGKQSEPREKGVDVKMSRGEPLMYQEIKNLKESSKTKVTKVTW